MSSPTPFKDPIVIYHGSCTDGFTAAWVVRQVYPNAEFRPAQYNQTPLPDDLFGRDVILLDFSWKRPEMLALVQMAGRVLVLDHHESAEQELAGLHDPDHLLEVYFDQGRSGAMLAWSYFFPGEPVPDLVRYVDDRDRWVWALPGSRAYSAALRTEKFTWDTWDAFADADTETVISHGESILAYQQALVEGLLNEAQHRTLQGHPAMIVNTATLQSEVGEAIYTQYPDTVAVCWFQDREGGHRYSLRSGPTGPNVREIAVQYGGGGHARAAGFRITDLSGVPCENKP